MLARRSAALVVLLGLAFVAAPVRADGPTDPRTVVTEFYDAFCKGDTATMERLYSPDVKWHDTIFSFPDRTGTMGMWRILCAPSNGGKFTYTVNSVDGDTVHVHWLADYKLLGRPIHNDVQATLVVKDGLIVSHVDDYSWKNWAKQAFPLGTVSNWPPVRWVLESALRLVMNYQIAHAPPVVAPPPPVPQSPGMVAPLEGMGH